MADQRTTVAAVAKLLDPDGIDDLLQEIEDEVIDLQPGIDAGHNLVDSVCLESGYTDKTLELIERWVSAHYCAVQLPKQKQESVKGLTTTYEGQSGLGLNFTRFGQQAMILDYAGNLAKVNAQATSNKSKPGPGKVYYVGGGD